VLALSRGHLKQEESKIRTALGSEYDWSHIPSVVLSITNIDQGYQVDRVTRPLLAIFHVVTRTTPLEATNEAIGPLFQNRTMMTSSTFYIVIYSWNSSFRN